MSARRSWRDAGTAAVLAILAVALAAPPLAARELAIDRFDVDLALSESGTLEVAETIAFRFTGAWNGIVRAIPVDYRTPEGFAFRLDLEPLAVTGEDGAPLRWGSRRAGHDRELKVWVPGAVDAVRAVSLRYRVRNAVRFFSDHDELYWNVTGDQWDLPIAAASAELRLPAAARNVRAAAYTGPYGSRGTDAEVSVEGARVTVRTSRPLGFREGLTIVVGWERGAVRHPSALARAWSFLLANAALALPLGVFALMFTLWRRMGRDPARLPVTVRYEPPEGLTPAEAGTLVDHRLDMRDVTATIVDLAVHGHLTIEEREESGHLGLGRSHDYLFRRTSDAAAAAALRPHEREVLDGLFDIMRSNDGHPKRGEVTLSALRNAFYRHLPLMRDRVYDGLSEHGFYRNRPDTIRKGFMVAGAVILFLSFHAAAFGAAFLGGAPVTYGVAVALTGLVVLGFGWFMPARTTAGARAQEAVLGFQEFLARVESDRYARVVRTPEMFERFLPYAMAFGVEAAWARAFEGICREPPHWYRSAGTGPFRPMYFGNALGDLSTRAGSVLSSAPRSSGGSGFGGGGHSGGGFGGGGGHGF